MVVPAKVGIEVGVVRLGRGASSFIEHIVLQSFILINRWLAYSHDVSTRYALHVFLIGEVGSHVELQTMSFFHRNRYFCREIRFLQINF